MKKYVSLLYYIMVVFFCFGQKLINRADSKNSFMTVTRMQKLFNFNFLNFQISKDIVWAYDFKLASGTRA
jgi:hypothetical protein